MRGLSVRIRKCNWSIVVSACADLRWIKNNWVGGFIWLMKVLGCTEIPPFHTIFNVFAVWIFLAVPSESNKFTATVLGVVGDIGLNSENDFPLLAELTRFWAVQGISQVWVLTFSDDWWGRDRIWTTSESQEVWNSELVLHVRCQFVALAPQREKHHSVCEAFCELSRRISENIC